MLAQLEHTAFQAVGYTEAKNIFHNIPVMPQAQLFHLHGQSGPPEQRHHGPRRDDPGHHRGEQLLLFMTEVSLLIMLMIYLGKGFVLNVVFGQVEPDVSAYASTY